jgi:seryl-tRNA synthetase
MSDQTQAATPATPEPNSTPDANASGSDAQKADKLFSQAELDAIVKDRLKRAEEKAQSAQAKAQADAAAKALEEQGEFKKLADERAKTVDTLTAEKETLTAQLEDVTAKAKKYETALTAILDAQKGSIPEHVRPLLDKLPIDEQMAWIAANQDKIKVSGVPFTPKADGTGLTAQQREAAQKLSDRQYRSRF